VWWAGLVWCGGLKKTALLIRAPTHPVARGLRAEPPSHLVATFELSAAAPLALQLNTNSIELAIGSLSTIG
jgi:hypothetical protein